MHRAGDGDALHLVNAVGQLAAAEGEEFHAPGPGDFEFPPLFGDGTFFTKPMLIIVLGTLAIAGLFYLASRRASLVPAKAQFLGESVYGFVRNGIVGDSIGREGRPFVPLLTTMFVFIAVMNLAGIIPVLQLPATSKIAIPLFLAAISWAVFNYVGIRRHGFVGYFKNMMFPPGIPKPVYVILAPLEFISTILVRPFTHAVRLFANMFAGHVLIAFFAVTAYYFIVETQGLGIVIGVAGFVMTIAMTGFEMFIQVLQAFIFTLLAAVYIQSSVEVDH